MAKIRTGLLVNNGLVVDETTKGFERLSFENVDSRLLKNPILKMLYREDSSLLTGRRGPKTPKDEWVVFLD